MPERHREFAERMYHAINHRDFDAFAAGAHEDVEFRSLVAESEGQVELGHQGMREWWTNVSQMLVGDLTERGRAWTAVREPLAD